MDERIYISNYFLKALSKLFEVGLEDISFIGDDDLIKIESFKRTPKVDLEINLQDGSKFPNLLLEIYYHLVS